MATGNGTTRHDRPAATRKKRGRWALWALLAGLAMLQPGVGSAGPQEDAATAACEQITHLARPEGRGPAHDAYDETRGAAKSATCLRFIVRSYNTSRTTVHGATLNVPSLLDVSGDGRPDLSAQIQVPGVDSISMLVRRLPAAADDLRLKIEAVGPIPTTGKEAAFGYDTGVGVQAPASLVVTMSKTVDPLTPANPTRYRLEITEYTAGTPGASLALVGALYTPEKGNGLGRINPIEASLRFSPFPPAPTSYEFAPDAGALRMTSPVRTLVQAKVGITNGSSVRSITGTIDKLPTSLFLGLDSLTDGRRRISYVASSSIDSITVTTRGISMGSLGTPDFTAVVRNLPASLTATLPTASAPLTLSSSGTVGEISVTANNVSLGKYKHLYATIAGIPAASADRPHTIAPPTESKLVDVQMAGGTSLGMIDVELTEGARLWMPSSNDGVYVRQELNPPAGRGEDAIHARLSGLRKLWVTYAALPNVGVADVIIDSTAGRRFVVRVDRQTASKAEYLQASLSSLRPNTRIGAGIGSITNTVSYSAGDSVRPRLDIDTNIGDRLSFHADVPAMPRTFNACVSFGKFCMRDADKRQTQRNSAHTKAFFSLDVKASEQMTINVLDCVRKNAGTTSICGQDGYGKWVKGSMTFQNIALDAWAEWVTEYWNGCDYCETDNILGHLFIDTDNTPVYTDINTDNTDGTDFNVDLNGLKAQNRQVWFDRDWTALLTGSGFNTSGTFTCGPNPELEFRPSIPAIDDPWINVAGFVC